MEQVVDRLEAHQHPELLLEEPSDVEPAECADAVLRTGRGHEALLQPRVLLRVQLPRASGSRAVVEGFDAPSVILVDPVLNGAERAVQGLGDVRGRASLLGEDDGLDTTPEPFLGDGLGQVFKVLQSMMIFDVHQ
jgi:hypothetical protein